MKFGILAGLLGIAATSLYAGDVTLTFEGIGNLDSIGGFYNGVGVNFESGEGLISTAAGGTGDFGGNPSGITIATPTVEPMTMDVAGGFTSLSFWYSDPYSGSDTVNVFDQVGGGNGNGNLIGSVTLPETPVQDAGGPGSGNCTGYGTQSNPGAQYCPFELETVTLGGAGVGYSVDFGGGVGFIGYDDVTLNECDATQTQCPQYVPPCTSNCSAPEPSTWLLFGTGGILMLFGSRRLKLLRKA